MNYFRRIQKPIDELKYKMQIAALTLSINKNKIDIESLNSNISSNLEKININKKNIVTILKEQVYYNKIYFNSIQIRNDNTGLIKIMNIPINYSFSNNNYTIEINASYNIHLLINVKILIIYINFTIIIVFLNIDQ